MQFSLAVLIHGRDLCSPFSLSLPAADLGQVAWLGPGRRGTPTAQNDPLTAVWATSVVAFPSLCNMGLPCSECSKDNASFLMAQGMDGESDPALVCMDFQMVFFCC